MSTKITMEFEGFEDVIQRLSELEGNIVGVTEKALKSAHRLVTKNAEKAIEKQNLPAKGLYSKGDTLKALYREGKVEWVGTVASIQAGFSVRKGGLASIFMMYGTPRYMKNQKLYNAFFGRKTQQQIRQFQEDGYYQEIRRLNG